MHRDQSTVKGLLSFVKLSLLSVHRIGHSIGDHGKRLCLTFWRRPCHVASPPLWGFLQELLPYVFWRLLCYLAYSLDRARIGWDHVESLVDSHRVPLDGASGVCEPYSTVQESSLDSLEVVLVFACSIKCLLEELIVVC